jgi:phage terminase small subunit
MTILANAKHEAVALAHLADPAKIGSRAYRKVYPKSSPKAAKVAFSRLLTNANFAARVAELSKEAAQAIVMAAQEVLEELSKLGSADVADYMRVGPDGNPVLNFAGLSRDQSAALVQVTVEVFMDGRGEDAREVPKVTFKLASKLAAIELLQAPRAVHRKARARVRRHRRAACGGARPHTGTEEGRLQRHDRRSGSWPSARR